MELSEFIYTCQHQNTDQVQALFLSLNPEARCLILQELPAIINDLLKDKNYTLLKKIISVCFLSENMDTPSDLRSHRLSYDIRNKSRYSREACIVMLIQHRPMAGPEESFFIQSIQNIIEILLKDDGVNLEIATNAYGTDCLNLCIHHFPELFDLLLSHNASADYSDEPAELTTGPSTPPPRLGYRSQNTRVLFPATIDRETIDRVGLNRQGINFDPSMNHALHTAIMVSNSNEQKELYKHLIRKLIDHPKTNLNDQDMFCTTPLMLAAYLGDIDTVKYLLQRGANVHIATPEGKTALFHALKYNMKETIVELLMHGAQLTTSYIDHSGRFFDLGRSAVQLARKYTHLETAEMLEKFQEQMLLEIATNTQADQPFMRPNGYHLAETTVPGDGDCLYHAVALQDELGRTARALREMVARFIETGDLNGFLEDEDPINYARRVREGLWGGQIEIRALMHILGRPIIVMHQDGRAPIHPTDITPLDGEPLFISYNGVNHYNGLSPATGYTAREIYSTHLPHVEVLHKIYCSDVINAVLNYLPLSEVYSKLNITHLHQKKSEALLSRFLGKPLKRKADKLQEADPLGEKKDEDDKEPTAKRAKK